MKLKELNEGIDTTEMRKRFRDTLELHKDELQSKMTTYGVTRALSKMFPMIDFSMWGGRNQADYKPDKDKLTIRNTTKFMKPSYIQKNWKWFADEMVSNLTHESIHREQNRRGSSQHFANLKTRRRDNLGVRELTKFVRTINQLRDLHDDAESRGFDDIAMSAQKDINRLLVNARQKGLELSGTSRNYLSAPHEITAYAEEIAQSYVDMVKPLSGKLNNDQIRSLIMGELKNSGQVALSPTLNRYQKRFKVGDKSRNRLYKQIVHYVDQKLQN